MKPDAFSKLEIDQKILFIGQTLGVISIAICSFGQLFRLLKNGEIAAKPTSFSDYQTDLKPQQTNYSGRPRTTGFFQS